MTQHYFLNMISFYLLDITTTIENISNAVFPIGMAIVGLALLITFIMLAIPGKSREFAKAHIGFIIIAILGIAGVSYFVTWITGLASF